MPKLNIKIKKQKPDECLPACLRAVFEYYRIKSSEEEIIKKISKNSFKLYDWDFQAGKLTIEKGLKAKIYSNVTLIFDPSWYNISSKDLIKKTEKQIVFFKERNENFLKDPMKWGNFFCPSKWMAEQLVREVKTLLAFLKSGGIINFSPISKELIEKFIDSKVPVITHHNPTLLHRMKRRYNSQPNDIKGNSWGHVIIISGYTKNEFIISDPAGLTYEGSLEYKVSKDLLLESILRYNSQLLIIKR